MERRGQWSKCRFVNHVADDGSKYSDEWCPTSDLIKVTIRSDRESPPPVATEPGNVTRPTVATEPVPFPDMQTISLFTIFRLYAKVPYIKQVMHLLK